MGIEAVCVYRWVRSTSTKQQTVHIKKQNGPIYLGPFVKS